MRVLEILKFYSKCKAPTKEELEMKALGIGKQEYGYLQMFRSGENPDYWFMLSKKKVICN